MVASPVCSGSSKEVIAGQTDGRGGRGVGSQAREEGAGGGDREGTYKP